MNNKEIVWFDIESTGLNVKEDRIVQLGVKINNKEYNWLINPTIPISPEASNVHNIYDKDVINKPTFNEVIDSVLRLFKDSTIGGYNIISFDIPLLINEFKRCGIEWVPNEVIDVFNIWKAIEKRTLIDCYKRYCPNESDFDAHDALEDVRATQKVFTEMNLLDSKKDYYKLSKPVFNKIIDNKIQFGKYKDKNIKDVFKTDPQYINWMAKNIDGCKAIIIDIFKK